MQIPAVEQFVGKKNDFCVSLVRVDYKIRPLSLPTLKMRYKASVIHQFCLSFLRPLTCLDQNSLQFYNFSALNYDCFTH